MRSTEGRADAAINTRGTQFEYKVNSLLSLTYSVARYRQSHFSVPLTTVQHCNWELNERHRLQLCFSINDSIYNINMAKTVKYYLY